MRFCSGFAVRDGRAQAGWFSCLLVGVLLFLAHGSAVAQERGFPISDADLAFAQSLVENGYADLAIALYTHLREMPGTSKEVKLEAGRGLLSAYRVLSAQVVDPEQREQYLQNAGFLVKELVDAYPEDKIPLDLLYEQAVVYQTEGRSLGIKVPLEKDLQKQALIIKESEERFDKALEIFVKLQRRIREEEEPLNKDPEKNSTRLDTLRAIRTRAALQVCWTGRYKALLYPEGNELRTTTFNEAIETFGRYIAAYEQDLSVLNALMGRGRCYHDLGKNEEALNDFNKVVELAATVSGNVPEVVGISTECAVQAAEIRLELGKLDEAQTGIDALLGAKVPADSSNGQKLGIEKAKILYAKSKTLRDTDPDNTVKLIQEAVKILGDIARSGTENAGAAREAMGPILKEKIADLKLGPVGKLLLAENYLSEGMYKEAVEQLQPFVDVQEKTDGSEIGFRARFHLVRAYRGMGDFEKSVKAAEELIAKYPASPEAPQVAYQRCLTLADWARAAGSREIDERHVQALKELAEKFPNSDEGRNGYYYFGGALLKRKRFAEAADAFSHVPTESQYHEKSRYLRGLAYYTKFILEYRRDRRVDQEAKQQAEKDLKWAIEEARPGITETWHIEAAVALCDLYLETARYEEVLNTFKSFATRYPQDAQRSPELLYRKIRALAAMDKLEEAAADLDVLAEQKADPQTLMRGYMSLADARMELAGRAQAQGREAEAAQLNDKARQALRKALPFASSASFDVWVWIAGRLYKLNDFEGAMEAALGAEKTFETSARRPDEAIWKLRLLRLKCIDVLDKWDEDAKKLLEELEKHYPQMADIKMKRAAYLQKYEKKYNEALEIWNKVVAGVEAGSPAWLEAQYNRAVCNRELGDRERAKEIVRVVRGLTKTMTPDVRKQFDELEASLK